MKSYPNEEFIVRSSKLFYRACKKVLALKKCSIEYHIKSQKHISGKKKLALAGKEEYNSESPTCVCQSNPISWLWFT